MRKRYSSRIFKDGDAERRAPQGARRTARVLASIAVAQAAADDWWIITAKAFTSLRAYRTARLCEEIFGATGLNDNTLRRPSNGLEILLRLIIAPLMTARRYAIGKRERDESLSLPAPPLTTLPRFHADTLLTWVATPPAITKVGHNANLPSLLRATLI